MLVARSNPNDRPFSRSDALRRKAHCLIPGGSHTYAKGDDQFPERSPGFIERGRGCHVWDIDGNRFIEYGMGLRAVTLGHAYAPVVAAAAAELLRGSNFTRPAAIETECAERFLELIKTAEMVKFTKDGSTVTTAAVRLARAFTGRDMVAICADDPFYSYDDWFIGSTPMAEGIPHAIRQLTVKFRYNDLASAQALFDRYPDSIACLILELERTVPPREGFLQALQRLCADKGALFVVDEMITGFRWHIGGAQQYYDLKPDLSCFGKAIANGFAVSALSGRREIMDLGGIHDDGERVFLLSSTHGGETHALAAAIKTMEIYEREDVVGQLDRQGRRLMCGLRQVIEANGVEGYVEVNGKPCNLTYVTRDADGKPSQWFRALFLQELIDHGVLAPSFVVSVAHDDEAIDQTIEAVDIALHTYRDALDCGVERYLVGPPVKPVFGPYR